MVLESTACATRMLNLSFATDGGYEDGRQENRVELGVGFAAQLVLHVGSPLIYHQQRPTGDRPG
jgi:hypothetical protein